MASAAHTRLKVSLIEARILFSFMNSTSAVSTDQSLIDQTCMKAAIANSVGCWEGYVEAVLKEFVAKTRINANRRGWALITQFEVMVDKVTSELNTPSWEKVRELLISITGIDPYTSWIFRPTFSNQQDSKEFFDGVMKVRHAFAHGFSVPVDIKALVTKGKIDTSYVTQAFDFIEFIASETDSLLEHELMTKHSCHTGWN